VPFVIHILICPEASLSARIALLDVGISAILEANEAAGGSFIDVNCNIWFVNEALDKVQMEAVRAMWPGLKYG
jgi:hypothetical protein